MPKSMQKDWVLLHLSKDFQASIKFEPCQILPRRQCVCGIKIIDGHQEEFNVRFMSYWKCSNCLEYQYWH